MKFIWTSARVSSIVALFAATITNNIDSIYGDKTGGLRALKDSGGEGTEDSGIGLVDPYLFQKDVKEEQENHKDLSNVEILNNAYTKYFQETSFGTHLSNATIEMVMEKLYLQTLVI